MGKTLLIAALLLATAPAYAATVTHCHTHTSGDGGDSDRDCETKQTLPSEEDIAQAHHMSNFWERRQIWRKEHCDEPLTSFYVLHQCEMPY